MRSAMKTALAAAAIAVSIVLAFSCAGKDALPEGLYARISTARGDIVVNLEYRKAPLTVVNFVGLAEGTLEASSGVPFYDGLTFHRVEPDFVIQGGDPAGDGSGDAGYNFPDEINPDLRHDAMGVVAMANHGANTNGSQFYITLGEAGYLDGKYSIFGNVIRGLDVIKKIKKGDLIQKIRIERIGAEAQAFKTDQAAFNALYASAAEAARERFQRSRAATIAQIKARWPGLVEGPNGFLNQVLKQGSGPVIRRFWLANVAYKGMLPDGTVFDDSSLHGGSIEFEVGAGNVIPGWEMLVMDMKKGEKRLVAIPPEFAYGQKGYAGVIPPDSYLVFELEVTGYTE